MKSRTSFVRRFRQMVQYYSSQGEQASKKRNYEITFGEREYEKERYGQEITDDYFAENQGHGVIVTSYIESPTVLEDTTCSSCV